MKTPRHTDPGSGILLALETAGSNCSVAVARGGGIVAAETRAMRHGHHEALLSMIDRVAGEAGIVPADIAFVAAATGPGGFTGIRAGLAAAQGIALGAGARAIGITSFAAVAALVDEEHGPLLVALDSRRADLYVQIFGRGPLGEPTAVLPERLAAYVEGCIGDVPLRIAGDAAETAAAALRGERDPVRVIPNSAPDARGVAAVAARRLLTGAALELLRPLYLRPPDVTLPKAR